MTKPTLNVYISQQAEAIWFVVYDNGTTVEKYILRTFHRQQAWSKRQAWKPAKAVEKKYCTDANRVDFNLMHQWQADLYGIPHEIHQHINLGRFVN